MVAMKAVGVVSPPHKNIFIDTEKKGLYKKIFIFIKMDFLFSSIYCFFVL